VSTTIVDIQKNFIEERKETHVVGAATLLFAKGSQGSFWLWESFPVSASPPAVIFPLQRNKTSKYIVEILFTILHSDDEQSKEYP